MNSKTLVLIAVVLALLAVPAAWGEDAPREGTRWLLKMEHGPLRLITVPGDTGAKVTYTYMTVEVTNPTPLARDWFPIVKALTDTNRTYVAMGYDHALDAIRVQEGNADLVPIGRTKGKIQAGETLDTVAIFGPLDPLYDKVRVQLLGLSDPIATYKLEKYPVTIELPEAVAYFQSTGDGAFERIEQAVLIQDVAYVQRNADVMKLVKKEIGEAKLPDPTVEYWEVTERRVYEMVYNRLGDEFRPDDDLISFEKEYWTIVGEVKALRQIRM